MIFEIDGAEHYHHKKRITSDKLKMELAEKKDVKMIRVPNQYVKHYEYIRELVNKVKGGSYQRTLFDD